MAPRLSLVLLLLALTFACLGGESRLGGDAGRETPVAGGPARFRVVNEGSVPIYLQVSGWYWGLSRGANLLQVADNCAICDCSDNPCRVCGPAGRIGQVAPIDPGRSRSWDWDGQIWTRDVRRDGKECERPEPLAPGALTLTVGHGTQLRELGVGGTEVERPLIETSVDFNHGAGVEVDVVIR